MIDPQSSVFEAAKQHFLQGLEAHKAGNLDAAERAYREALVLTPDRPSILGNLGLLLMQAQRFAEAEVILRKKVLVENASVESLLALGSCQMALGKPADALSSFERVLIDEPHNTVAMFHRGNILYEQGNPAAAAECFERLLRLAPNHLDALNNRVGALAALGRHSEALACAQKALALAPAHTQTLCNHGNVLAELGRYPEALASFDKALQADADYFEALSNRGGVLLKLGRPVDAGNSLRAALAIRPDHVQSITNLARVYLVTRNVADALTTINRVLAMQLVDAEQADARVIRGNALLAQGRSSEALADFDQALVLKPDDADVLNSRCDALLLLDQPQELIRGYERLLSVDANYDYARGCLLNTKLQCCDWRGFDKSVAEVKNAVVAGKRADLPFTFLAISDSARDQLTCARTHAAHGYPAVPAIWQGQRYDHERIRVAYLSSDLREHAVAHLAAGLFEAHDKTRFETVAVSFGPESADGMRSRIQVAFSRFLDVRGKSDHAVAVLLREMEIDIAVDINAYTRDHRAGILAHRAAPIQVNYLGYPGTMGAKHMDYIIADRVVIPEADRVHYEEKVVYLPDTYQANDSKRRIALCKLTRQQAGLPDQGIVFCCFNNHYKITPKMFDVWMRILGKVDGSVLWLVAGNPETTRNLCAEAQRRSIAPERLVFAPRMRPDDHWARHGLADIFLDTLPYNAHTTASDALRAGLPVVTCTGTTFAGRVATSLLRAMGLPELITSTLDDYETLAVTLANDRQMLAQVKARVESHRETYPLFDTGRYCRHLEAAYQTMWERYQSGERPQGFAVPALA